VTVPPQAEGRDFGLELRYASGQLGRLGGLATELIHAQVDLIVAVGLAIDAVRRATNAVLASAPDVDYQRRPPEKPPLR
jgi:hypothetical protein